MIRTTLDEAETNLRVLIAAALRGEEVYIIATDAEGEQVVRLVSNVSASHEPRRRKAGSAKGMIWMAEDFDAPLEDFDEYQ